MRYWTHKHVPSQAENYNISGGNVEDSSILIKLGCNVCHFITKKGMFENDVIILGGRRAHAEGGHLMTRGAR